MSARAKSGRYDSMARYTGPVTRISRRLNTDLVGGDTSFERRPYPPGQHGQARPKFSEYSIQLREKQKVKRIYGLMENQFRRTFAEALVAMTPREPLPAPQPRVRSGWSRQAPPT